MGVISTFIRTILLIIFPSLLFGQTKTVNSVQLKSGSFVPVKNFLKIIKDQSLLKPSLFQNNYYVIIQFNQIPSQQERENLNDIGIELFDYLPQNAYTAIIPISLKFSCIKKMPINSIFILQKEQKISTEIREKYLIKTTENKNTLVDVNVITFQKLSASVFEKELTELQSSIISEQPNYRTFTIRVPIYNLYNLAALPFVQWVEPVAPPDVIEGN